VRQLLVSIVAYDAEMPPILDIHQGLLWAISWGSGNYIFPEPVVGDVYYWEAESNFMALMTTICVYRGRDEPGNLLEDL